MDIRIATLADHPALSTLMFAAIQANQHYTPQQRNAWQSEPKRVDQWPDRLHNQVVYLAWESEVPVGFLSLRDDGYLDLAFVAPEQQGRGVFRQLYQHLENENRPRHPYLWTHASLAARPAFEAVGFSVVQEESVATGGQVLRRFEMRKELADVSQA